MHRTFEILLLTFLSAACAKAVDATQCRSDAECPSGSRCHSGVCVANQSPVASLRAVGAVEAFALVELDGSASHDSDPGDAVAAHLWTVRSLDAPCRPPEVASRGPRPFLRFACAGTYEVSLVVRDSLAMESEPARQEVRVVPAPALARIAVGPDLVTEHVCAGAPLTCVTEDAVALSADASPGLSLRWSVVPPSDRPLDAARRVRFFPDESAARPVAVIETDGTPISGDWIFVVEARDAYGAVGAAATRVSVMNRAPVVTIAPYGAFPHVFEPGRSVFLSSGALSWSVVDPDGDPVDATATWRHSGDGGASFDGDLSVTAITFSVEVPYGAPEHALLLRGGADLDRRIELAVRDGNGGEGRADAPIAIGNRPPIWIAGAVDAQVPHRFDRLGSRYVATVRAGTFVDPDGDPMAGVPGAGPCGTVALVGGEATVECSVPFAGVLALDQLVGKRTFTVPVRDPWESVASAPVQTAEILNAPPGVWGSPSPATRSCRNWGDGLLTLILGGVTFDLVPTVYDPEGDPVVLSGATGPGGSVSPATALSTGTESIPFRFYDPGATVHAWGVATSFLVASDGASSVQVGVSPAYGSCAY